MHPFGVKVLCIEPGFFKTGVTDTDLILRNIKMLWERLPKETKDDYGDEYLSKGIFEYDKFSIKYDGYLKKIIIIYTPLLKFL